MHGTERSRVVGQGRDHRGDRRIAPGDQAWWGQCQWSGRAVLALEVQEKGLGVDALPAPRPYVEQQECYEKASSSLGSH